MADFLMHEAQQAIIVIIIHYVIFVLFKGSCTNLEIYFTYNGYYSSSFYAS